MEKQTHVFGVVFEAKYLNAAEWGLGSFFEQGDMALVPLVCEQDEPEPNWLSHSQCVPHNCSVDGARSAKTKKRLWQRQYSRRYVLSSQQLG